MWRRDGGEGMRQQYAEQSCRGHPQHRRCAVQLISTGICRGLQSSVRSHSEFNWNRFSFFLNCWKLPDLGLSFQIISIQKHIGWGLFSIFSCLSVGLFYCPCNLEVVLYWKTATSAQEADNCHSATQTNRGYWTRRSRKKFVTSQSMEDSQANGKA